MADPWRSGGSSTRSSSSPWRSSSSGSRPTPVTKKKKRATPWGAIGNLWGDVQDAAVGIGTLPVLLGRQYVKEARKRPYAALSPLTATKAAATVLAKPTIESYRYQYGPLARGDVGEFGHRLYEHPLGPILDLASVVSLGASAAAKAGIAPAALKRGYVTVRTPSGTLIRKPLAKQTLRAELQVASNAALNKLPSEFPKLGEGARAGKALKKTPLRTARARELVQEPFLRTLGKVRSPNQRAATFWMTQVPHPDDLGRLVSILEEEGSDTALATAAILRSPKVAQAYAKPTPKMLRIHEEAGYVAEAQRAILGITDDVATRRTYMPSLIARGAKVEQRLIPPPEFASVDDFLRTIEDELDNLGAEYPARHGLKSALISARGGRTEIIYEPAPGFASIDDMIAKIDADLDAAGRPRPVYMPHTSEIPKAADIYGVGGKGPQRRPGPLHQTMGVLLGKGQVIADPRVLRQSFAKSIKFRLYDDIHQLHVEHARPVDALPQNWQFVRRKHSERIPYTAKTAQDFEDFSKSFLDEEGELTPRKPEIEFTTTNTAEAMADAEGRYLAVPQAFSNQLAGEFTRSGKFVYLMNKYPVRVWRHLVLKLRPAWLVNNILGNTLLYLVHSSDPVALQEIGRGFKRAFPRKADAFDEILRKHFPEQVHGTFIGSQLPLYQGGKTGVARAEHAASFLGAGLAQVDRIWEQSLRSSIVRAELRKSPALKKFSGKMRQQTDEFSKLADDALSADPLLVERVSNRVNDALGDFMALGRIERDFIRSAFPFYAWFRVITGIAVKLPLTHPVKATLLSRLGQSGATSVLEELGMPEEDVINGAKGFVGLRADEDGRIRGLATTSVNPLSTVADLQNSVVAMAMAGVYVSGLKQRPYDAPAPWENLPGVNPVIGLPIEALTGARGRGGTNRYGLLGAIPQFKLGQQLTGRVYKGSPGKPTYYDQDAIDALLRYFGIPYARVSPQRIRELSER